MRNLYLPVGFLLLLLAIFLGIWLYTLIEAPGEAPTRTGESGGFFSALFPFGDTVSSIIRFDEEGGVPVLRTAGKISLVTEAPVAGATFVTQKDGVHVRYVERETGHIYDRSVSSPTVVRLSNTTIPAIQEARWLTASSTVLRYISDGDIIENYFVTISSTTPDQTVEGIFLKPYVRLSERTSVGVVVSTEGSVLERIGSDGVGKPILASPLTAWIPHESEKKVFVASGPSGTAVGALYEVDSQNLLEVLGGFPGFEALVSREGNILFSSGSINQVGLFSLQGNGARAALPLQTLVGKCAWVNTEVVLCGVPQALPAGLYPDDWLLGAVHTSDDLWLIGLDGNTELVSELATDTGSPTDVYRVVVSADGQWASFIDKNTNRLWLVSLAPTP